MFDSVKSVVDELDKVSASSIEILQNLLKEGNVKNQLTYISANLSFLCDSIKTVNEIHFVESKVSSLTGSKMETL